MTTAVGATHPTGMHSCLFHEIPRFPKIFPDFFLVFIKTFSQKTFILLNMAFTYYWGSVLETPIY